MPAKRKNPVETGHGASADPVDQEQSIDDNPSAKSTGLKSSLHGNVFQLKLLVLFLIRAIKAKYQFKLGTEIPGMGGKFDDLIFKYEVMDENSMIQEDKTERYRYLQAKHKQNEETGIITAAELLNDNDGEFSLPKYFRSYYHEVINGNEGCLPNNVRDCIICTNVGFEDETKLKEAGIELLRLDDKDEILTFNKVSDAKLPTRYKLKKTKALCWEMAQWSTIHLLAQTFLEKVTNQKQLNLKSAIIKSYHVALVEENVIDKDKKKLCSTFLEGDNSRFREILSEVTFVHYWEKLNFNFDDKKKIRVDGIKKLLIQFEEISLENLLPKYPKNKTQSMDFRVFEDFYDDLISENVLQVAGKTWKKKPFTQNFIKGKDLTEKGSEFRGKLRNVVFIHFWKHLTFTLSEAFGRKMISSTPDENRSLNDLVGEKEIGDFLDKLVFAVHTPNEVQLDDILKREVSDCYSLHEDDFKSDFILRSMLDWFKKKESTFMTLAEGNDILGNAKKKMKSLRLTAVSIDYQKKLKEVCGFNEESIQEMAETLKQLLISENKVKRIASELPKRTAVKVIAALKELRRSISHETTRDVTAPEEIYFKTEDSYLMAPFSELNKKYEKFKKALKSDISHHLLIVICEDGISTEDEKYYEELVKQSTKPKKVIVISNDGAGIKDDVKFTDFSNELKKNLLSKQVSFQGSTLTVAYLIKTRSDQTLDELIQSGEPDKIFDLDSIEELIKQEKSPIQIPSLSSSRFEKSLYIKRQLSSAFPFDNEFWEEVAKQLDLETSGGYSLEKLQRECRVSQKGEIEWNDPIVNDEQKTKIWEKMNSVLGKRKSLAGSSNILAEDDLSIVDRHEKEKNSGVVIIAGVAGAGKSSILSHYYEEIKEKDPNHWVIIINFTDHSKDFLKLNSYEVNLSTTIDCIVNLSVVVGNSSFGRSMLRRRLELGDRITILFDGFDEIVKSQYQETAIRVINVLKENKSAGLYVTTRSHTASHLQFRLSQLTFDLENFSKEDQINYLTSLWKLNFKDDVEDNLRHFAELLVDRISQTLKDGERAFIGIPLQCRILAECFETDVQNSAQNQSELNSLVESIEKMNLDVADLYRLLVTKKRKIYEEEKKALSQSNDLADSHVNFDIDNLESFLRKLAIKTIVSTKEEVNILLGTQEKMKSKNEQDKKTKKRTDHSTRFGLLDENAEGKVRFLHRTYAEYMMAEYLYTGFLLDDDKRNKLLDFDSARKLIIDKILVKEQYDGVQVFFDSMLKEIVNENKEWENIIVKENLPERLYKLAEDLYRQFLRQNQKPYLRIPSNALRVSVLNRKEQIFNFLCDCLDATFDKSTVKEAVRICFLSNTCGFDYMFTLKHFCHQHIKNFRRFIGYYGDVLHSDDNMKQTSKFFVWLIKGLPLSGLDEHSDWNGSQQQKLVDALLDFMLANQKAIDPVFCSAHEHDIHSMFAMFIFNENYDSQLHKFLKILSDSKFYINENNFSNLLKNVLQSVKRKHRPKDRIGKAITILQTLGRRDVLNKLYGLVLTMEPDAFQSIYYPANHYEILHLKKDLSSFLEQDSYRMTHIHRAAFHGDTVAIEEILRAVKEILADAADPELRGKAEQVVKIMSHDVFGFTPFYLASACGHENIYRNMLVFLKDVNVGTSQEISDNFQRYLTAADGFIFHALSDAMESENLNMFQTILNAVKTVLGQDSLLHLLKSEARENKGKIRYDNYPAYCWPTTIFGVASRYAELFHSLAKIVVQDGGNENYQDFDDLIFFFLKTEEFYRFTLKHINAEILQGMLSLNGSNDWTKRLLDIDGFLVDGFDLLSKRLLKNFREDQLRQFIEMIISKENTDKSYWSKITESVIQRTGLIHVDEISLFLKSVSEKLDESFVVKLATHDDVTMRSDELTNCMFAHLSPEGQEEVKRHWKQIAALKINEIFFEPTSKNFWLSNKRTFRIQDVNLYLKYGSDAQLSDFVRVVTSLHNAQENKQCSVWGHVLKHGSKMTCCEILKHVAEKETIFGRNATKTLLLHEIDEEPLILQIAAEWKHNVDSVLPAMLSHLPNAIQDEMQQYLKEHAPKLVDKAFSNPTLLMPSDQSYRRLNTLLFLLNYCNENQLQLFFERITFLQDASHTMKKISIWGDLFRCECEQDDITMMDKFLGCVSKKLGPKTVKKLVFHADEGKDAVILHTASREEDQMVEKMLNYLDVEDRKKAQRKVDKYLRKNFNPPERKAIKIQKMCAE